MKQYHYYEFQAVDRALSKEDRKVISRLSNRLQLTPNQAIFVYYTGNFPGDPQEVLLRYFDVMLYLTNWGTKQLTFRFPKSLIDVEHLRQYTLEGYITYSTVKDSVLLSIYCADESNTGWIDGEGWLPALLPLRNAVLRQDDRILYLAWLMAAQQANRRHADFPLREPPLPCGLQALSEALHDFVEFFKIDRSLLELVAQAGPIASETKAPMAMRKAIKMLSRDECDDFLLRLSRGEPLIRIELARRLAEFLPQNGRGAHYSSTALHDALANLQTAAEEKHKQEDRNAPINQGEDAPIREETALETLSQHESQLWLKVNALIERKQSKAYEEALQILLQLKDVAMYKGTETTYHEQITQLHKKYSRLSGLRLRLTQAGLLPEGL